jgi:hypothetical protein
MRADVVRGTVKGSVLRGNRAKFLDEKKVAEQF